jgi:hypothetical protein
MKKNTLMMMALASVMMLGACGSKTETTETTAPEAATETPADQQVAVNTTHAFVCPMNCENSARMEMGQCVVCGMDLVSNPNYVAETAPAAGDSAAAGHEGHDHDHGDHEGHSH